MNGFWHLVLLINMVKNYICYPTDIVKDLSTYMEQGGLETNIVIAIHKDFPRLLVKNLVSKAVKIKIIGVVILA